MELRSYFKELGLSEYETKAYSSLVELKRAKAGNISASSKVPQSKIYGVLDSLADKGLVTILPSKPKLFQAITPKIAIDNLIKNKKDNLTVLENNKSNILNTLTAKLPIKQDNFQVNTFFGRNTYAQIGKYLLRNTKNECLILVERFDSRAVDSALAINKFGKIKLMIRELNSQNASIIKKMLDSKIPVRLCTISGFRLLISDDNVSGICVSSPKNPSSYTTMIFNGKEFNKSMKNFYKAIWERSKKITIRDLKNLI
jgi:sugar-specific transcriptional regulator TrmB